MKCLKTDIGSGLLMSHVKSVWTDKVCDAVEVAGKNVMSTTSVVTTGLVSERYC